MSRSHDSPPLDCARRRSRRTSGGECELLLYGGQPVMGGRRPGRCCKRPEPEPRQLLAQFLTAGPRRLRNVVDHHVPPAVPLGAWVREDPLPAFVEEPPNCARSVRRSPLAHRHRGGVYRTSLFSQSQHHHSSGRGADAEGGGEQRDDVTQPRLPHPDSAGTHRRDRTRRTGGVSSQFCSDFLGQGGPHPRCGRHGHSGSMRCAYVIRMFVCEIPVSTVPPACFG